MSCLSEFDRFVGFALNPLQPGVAFRYPNVFKGYRKATPGCNELKYKSFTVRCYFSIPPENIRKPTGFLMFSVGIEKQHRVVMN